MAHKYGLRRFTAAAILLLAGCGNEDDPLRSLDGGSAIDLDPPTTLEEAEILERDPCRRRERGGWHYSAGHCMPMTTPRHFSGVWVTANGESSFFPGAASPPHPDDVKRYTIDVELDDRDVERMAGKREGSLHGDAYRLSFVGRRTRDPYHVDCFGSPYSTYVVDRLEAAHYLGPMAAGAPPPRSPSDLPPWKPFKPSGKSGVIGRLEQEALAQCSGAG